MSWCARVCVPMNSAPADSRPVPMARRAENTTVDIHHQPGGSPKFSEDRIKILTLSDVPERLGMVQWDDAVVLRRIPVPSRAIVEIGPEERRNFSNCISDDVGGNDIPNHHVTVGMEPVLIFLFDPLPLFKAAWRNQRPVIIHL